MGKYEILDDDGNVVNRIKASRKFVEAEYPDRFREVHETKTVEVVKSIPEQLAEIIEKLDELLDKNKPA
jgi:protein-tyrosine phosphatase